MSMLIFGIVLLVLGIGTIVVGVVVHAIQAKDAARRNRLWWVYLIVFLLGIAMGIGGGFAIAAGV